MSNLLLLDLDGTVREPASGAKFINDSKDQRLIKGVAEAIAPSRITEGFSAFGVF